MASNWKNGWVIAEPIVLLTGFFAVLSGLVELSALDSPIDALLILSTWIPVIPSVAIVSFVIWAYRGKVSNRALDGSVALGCCSWLPVAFGIGGGMFGIVIVMFPVMVSLYLLNASAERKRIVNN